MTDQSDHGAYEALIEADHDSRWAFGTGFDDPLAGVDTTMPVGVDGADLGAYCLMLADDALVMSQRLAQWSTRAPELEEEVALANIGLDLLGQARLLLARGAAADPSVVPVLPAGSPVPAEDALAFFREEMAFRNVRLVELDNGDFARSSLRLLVFAAWRLALLQQLRASRDTVLAAVAAKGVKEVTYHRDYAARWVVTLAQGTPESRRRTVAALHTVWPYVEELLGTHPVERRLAVDGVGVDPASVREELNDVLSQVLAAADLATPEGPTASAVAGRYGRHGLHTEAMGPLLAELQVVARAHPSGLW
ncbi:MAG: phenylacetate-CoA oxygenase subunit PaaC [Actinomycetota bacterium]|nr:phenylacetate-CoA oxygenase subunit PaaC [Actinomycetota bacterium]